MKNQFQIQMVIETDLLIVGSGIAGLSAVEQAGAQNLRSVLITKNKIAGGASFFSLKATLGIQVTGDEDDKVRFREDITRVGKGMNNPEVVETYLNESKQGIEQLQRIGFQPWLRQDNRPACFANYPRPIYLINDWANCAKKAQAILEQNKLNTQYEYSVLVKIITQDNHVLGAVFQQKDESGSRLIFCRCHAIILASGGVASLYKNNLYPNDILGSTHAIALDAGALSVNMEFIQFIPAFLAPKRKVLFGEHTLKYCTAVYDSRDQRLFNEMTEQEFQSMMTERSDYAPFSVDFAAKHFDLIIMNAIQQGSNGVRLEFSPTLYQDQNEFYRVYLDWLKQKIGIDLLQDRAIIEPFAHSCNGGIEINQHGESAVSGLFAIGEVSACIEGANRLGGNSVGGSLVFAARAVQRAKHYCQTALLPINLTEIEQALTQTFPEQTNSQSVTASEILAQVRESLTLNANVYRNQQGLQQSLTLVERYLSHYSVSQYGIELYWSLRCAEMLLQSMLARQESRGAHFRSDYPHENTEIEKLRLRLQQGKIQIERFKEITLL
ncbi:fumarate reductase [Chelonobacter oris]|uniref:FAD-binding protein n=1 Tax=Chelonobacter oris TaxID=505317 RepID=UPI00244A5F62|nr:FAD-binding protein [Chelonobacter oris]MDH3000162.1 fumarate reductase [Chelonobacter oris]